MENKLLQKPPAFADAGFLLGSSIAALGVAASSLLSYLFHFLMVRSLPVDSYGDLSVLIGAFAILTFPASGVQSILSNEVLRLRLQNEGGKESFFISKYLNLWGRGAALAILACAAISLFFPPLLPACLMAAAVALTYGLCIPGAHFQGREHVLAASFLQAFVSGIKLLLSASALFLGFGLLGAVASFPLSALLAMLALCIPLLSLGSQEKYKTGMSKKVGLVFFTGIIFTLFLYLDLFAAWIFQGPKAAGIYNTASITSRIIYFLCAGLVLTFMPKSAKLALSQPRKMQIPLIAKSLLFLLPPLALFLLFPREIITFFYTPGFAGAADSFAILSTASFLFSIFFLACNMFWAWGDEKTPFAISMVGVLLNTVLLAILGSQSAPLSTFALASLLSSAVLAIASLLIFFGWKGKERAKP